MAVRKKIDVRKTVMTIDGMWKPLNDAQRDFLVENSHVALFRKNQSIFNEGETPLSLMCLVSGKVKVFKGGVGRCQIIRMISPGNMFGYRAYFAEENYQTSATAVDNSVVLAISLKAIETLVRENGNFAYSFIQLLSGHLGTADRRTVSLTQKHIRGRLAESLLVLESKYGHEADGTTLNVYLSREDIAHLSNMTTSNAIRTLASFADEQIIALDGRKIRIIKDDELKHISEMG